MIEGFDTSELIGSAAAGIVTAFAWLKGQAKQLDKKEKLIAIAVGVGVVFICLALIAG